MTEEDLGKREAADDHSNDKGEKEEIEGRKEDGGLEKNSDCRKKVKSGESRDGLEDDYLPEDEREDDYIIEDDGRSFC